MKFNDLQGGVLSQANGIVEIHKCNFTNNMASSETGGVFDVARTSLLQCNDSIFDGNFAYDEGGVIATSDTATVTVHHCTATNNRAFGGGGFGTFTENSNFTTHHSRIEGNSAESEQGGAFLVQDNSFVSISHSEIIKYRNFDEFS
jgi:hypothetical protein